MSNLEKLQQLNTNVPRETAVFSLDNTVVKRPINLHGATQQTVWLEKQKSAQKIQDFLRSKKNPAYFVPQMLEISCDTLSVVEERVYGQPLTTDFVKTLSDADKDIIYRGLAHFICDMATYKPILTQSEFFDMPGDKHKHDVAPTFAYILNHMKKFLKKPEIEQLRKAKAFFDTETLNDANVVFSHGDINEHNVFYNTETKKLSVIDVADAKYENAHDMIYRNYANLKWLDVNRLVTELNKIPQERPIITNTNPALASLRNALQSIKWSGVQILKNPNNKSIKIRLEMLHGETQMAFRILDTARASVTNAQDKHLIQAQMSAVENSR